MRLAPVILAGLALSLGLAAEPLRPAATAASASSPVQLAEDASAPPASSPSAPPSDLPTVEVKPRPVHTVPDDTPPPPPVTLRGHDGSAFAAPRPDTAVRHEPPVPLQIPTLVISGTARVDGSVSISVRGRVVPLFGVRAPASGDRCAVAPGPSPRACAEVAKSVLASRLPPNTMVSCRVPPGQHNGRGAAICLDSTGVDLGGFLVGEGFVLADPAQSFDYVGAEGVARSYRRGLWRYR